MLRSLYRRPGGRRLAALLNLASGGRVAEIPVSPPFDLERRDAEPVAASPGEVTKRLWELIDEDDLAELLSLLTTEAIRQLDATEAQQRPFAELALCVDRGLPSVLEKTGLSAASPPEHIHAMGRGPLAAGGSYYYADLVVEGLRAGGGDPSWCSRALDFGCSSGRVVRVLAAAYPDTEWHGCDPNEAAVAWARENLHCITFEVSPTEPPLRYPGEHFDLVIAISIWSHLSEKAAVAWLNEMARVVGRGGYLLLTGHGYQSVAHNARSHRVSYEDLARATTGMYRRGFWFIDNCFGGPGDNGVQSADWGLSFLSPEWMLTHAPPAWSVVGFEAGRAEGNQDLYVLQRRERSRRRAQQPVGRSGPSPN